MRVFKQTLVAFALALSRTLGVAHASDPPPRIDLESDRPSRALDDDVPVAPVASPPPPPYKRTFVIDSSLGALVFLCEGSKTAPAGPLFRTQRGYELFKSRMVFG